MLQLNFIRDNKEEVLKRLAIKNFKDAESIINKVIELDNSRRNTQKDGDTRLKLKQNPLPNKLVAHEERTKRRSRKTKSKTAN